MLTKDNIPVTIDAILRYKIIETSSKDALLNVENFKEMIQQVSQTRLRNMMVILYFKMYYHKEKKLIKILNRLFQKKLVFGDGVNRSRDSTGDYPARLSLECLCKHKPNAREAPE